MRVLAGVYNIGIRSALEGGPRANQKGMLMTRQLFAVLLASVMLAAPMARADVVLYGKIYAEVASEQTGNGATQQTNTTVDDAQNLGRLGVKFDQDLGNGLTAFGKYEFSLNAPDSSHDFKMRDAFVGLRGSLGSIAMGRFDGAYKTTGGVNWDPFAFTSLQLAGNGGQSNTNFGNAGFIDRAIELRTRDYQDGDTKFSGVVQYGADDSAASTTTPSKSVLAGIDFSFGGGVEFVYAVAHNGATSTTNSKVGARAVAGDATFVVVSENVESGGFDPGGKGDFLTGIFTYQIGNFMWVAELADYNSGFTCTGCVPNLPNPPLDVVDASAGTYAVGFRYYWAKNIWTVFGYRSTESKIDPQDSSAVALGLRYDF